MFKSKFTKLAAALAMSLGTVGAAQAFVIQAGDFKLTVDAYDSATSGYGAAGCASVAACDAAASSKALGSIGSVNTSADTMGIFSVASITRLSDNSQWFTRGADGYLTGIFGNLMDYSVTTLGGFTAANAVGGTWSMWLNTTDYDKTQGPAVVAGVKDLNAGLYSSISGAGGTKVLEGVFAPGADIADPLATFSTFFNSSRLAGSSSGFMDVTGGAWQNSFDTDGQLFGRDLFASFTFAPTTESIANKWTVAATAGINGSAVPEPGSLALLSLGLLAAGVATRRRNGQGK